jgi:hypothetical protein
MCIHAEPTERPDIYPGVWSYSDPKLAAHLIIASTIHDANAWLEFHHHIYRDLTSLCFLIIGNVPEKHHAEYIQNHAPNKKLHFIFSKDDIGAICDLKLASYIRNKPLKIRYDNHVFNIQFENKSYQLPHLSLNSLEKASGYNFRIRTHKPKSATNFYEQLRNRHQP